MVHILLELQTLQLPVVTAATDETVEAATLMQTSFRGLAARRHVTARRKARARESRRAEREAAQEQ